MWQHFTTFYGCLVGEKIVSHNSKAQNRPDKLDGVIIGLKMGVHMHVNMNLNIGVKMVKHGS